MATNKIFECEICNVTTSDQISFDNHLLGSKHQLMLHTKHVRNKKEKCSIYITGFSNSVKKEDIIKFFTHHGKIVDFFPESVEKFVIIQFENENIVDKLLKTTIYFQGRKLAIKRRVLKNTTADTKKPPQDDKAILTGIVEDINTNLEFTVQLKQLIDKIQLPFNKTMTIYNQLCTDIQRCLNTKFVNCRVWPFGSTVSGLGFKQSDVDVFIEVLCHPPIADETESNLAAAYVRLARNLLSKSNYLFSHVIAIPKAKTPIVKCTHIPTGVNCDMNFKNMLGVCNSRLINFMLNLDARLRPLMIIIKFWAKIQDISGSGRISNYGLTMMYLFYLQQHPDPIVPPIGWLQTAYTVQFHEGWNGGFCDDLRFLPNLKTDNKRTIPELLHGFFQFYSKYDFGFNVICPLIGENIPKMNFVTADSLPEKLFHYKNMLGHESCRPFKYQTPLCIQDPFELSHNITSFVAQRLLEDFQKLCQISRDICSECDENKSDLLKRIFAKQNLLSMFGATDDQCLFKMQVNATVNYIDVNEIKANADGKTKILRELWFEKLNQFLISALSKIFLFDVTIKKDIQRNKFQKVDGQSDIHDNNIIDTIQFHCIGHHNVWDARKSIAKTFNQVESNNGSGCSATLLDREIAITDYIVNVLCKGIKIAEPIVDFNLEFNSRVDPTEAEFIMHNVNSRKNSFRHMANFFATKLPLWFEICLKQTTGKPKNENIDSNESTSSSTTTKTTEINTVIKDIDKRNDDIDITA